MRDNSIRVEHEQLKEKRKRRQINSKQFKRSLPMGAPNLSSRPELNRTRLRTSKLTNELFDGDEEG